MVSAQQSQRGRGESYEQHVLQFVLGLLGGQHLTIPSAHGKREVYRETVQQLGQMLSRASLAFLIEEGGWRVERYVREDEDDTRRGRIWEAPMFASRPPSFHHATLELCWLLMEESAVMAATTGHKPREAVMTALLESSVDGSPWDGLAVYLLSRAFARQRGYREMVQAVGEHSPWVQLMEGGSRELRVNREAVEGLLEAWGWTTPWLRETFARPWAVSNGSLLERDLEYFEATLARLQRVVGGVVDVALDAGRHEWLLPVLDYFRMAYDYKGSPEVLAEPLHIFTSTIKISKRQRVFDAWAELLKLLTRLEGERQRIGRTHPIDREAGEKLFLAVWQDDSLDATFEKVENLRTHLQRVVG